MARECALCGQTFYGYVDDEICFDCETNLQNEYHQSWIEVQGDWPDLQEELAWHEGTCERCGYPNPICECSAETDDAD